MPLQAQMAPENLRYYNALVACLQLSEGNIQFETNNSLLPNEEAYRQLSFCAPYLDVIEEMTLIEFLQFHNQFKPFIKNFSISDIIEEIGLKEATGKQIRYYSSG